MCGEQRGQQGVAAEQSAGLEAPIPPAAQACPSLSWLPLDRGGTAVLQQRHETLAPVAGGSLPRV